MNTPNVTRTDLDAMTAIARMAYGSREKTKGGVGNIGFLRSSDGSTRVVKFNTHAGEATKVTQEQIDSCNKLRTQLLLLAKSFGVRADVMRDIRKKLGIREDGDVTQCTKLLDRKIVAKVLTKIDDKVWDRALSDGHGHAYDMSQHKSGKSGTATFDAVKNQSLNANSLKVADLEFAKFVNETLQAEKQAFLETEMGKWLSLEGCALLDKAIASAAQQRAAMGRVGDSKNPAPADEAALRTLARVNIARVLMAYGEEGDAKNYVDGFGQPGDFEKSGFEKLNDLLSLARKKEGLECKGLVDRFILELNSSPSGVMGHVPQNGVVERTELLDIGAAFTRAQEFCRVDMKMLGTWTEVDKDGALPFSADESARLNNYLESLSDLDDKVCLGSNEDRLEPFRDLSGKMEPQSQAKYEEMGNLFLSYSKQPVTVRQMKALARIPSLARVSAGFVRQVLQESDPERRAVKFHDYFKQTIATYARDRGLTDIMNKEGSEFVNNFVGTLVFMTIGELTPDERKAFKAALERESSLQSVCRFLADGNCANGAESLTLRCTFLGGLITHLVADKDAVLGDLEKRENHIPPYEVYRDAPKSFVQREYEALDKYVRGDVGKGLLFASYDELFEDVLIRAKEKGVYHGRPTKEEYDELSKRFDDIITETAKRLHVETKGASGADEYGYDPEQYLMLMGLATADMLERIRAAE